LLHTIVITYLQEPLLLAIVLSDVLGVNTPVSIVTHFTLISGVGFFKIWCKFLLFDHVAVINGGHGDLSFCGEGC